MPRFHFHIQENGRLIRDDEGQEFAGAVEARKEAVETGASIARDAFISGSAYRVIVDVREEEAPFLKVSITLDVEEPTG
jgi:dTDP-4-dehydrorhamnose 3,5-epimerase-like enzyme